MANDRGQFWEGRVRSVRKNYNFKEGFMADIRLWFEEPDIGLADIAWDLVSMELGEDNL